MKKYIALSAILGLLGTVYFIDFGPLKVGQCYSDGSSYIKVNSRLKHGYKIEAIVPFSISLFTVYQKTAQYLSETAAKELYIIDCSIFNEKKLEAETSLKEDN